ncbi:2TM domain-containing protein [Lewinella sp. IMCC34191]|uniref:2TM domain-containing protein n=1 Tax=Lewinella sp. IMCC34191 TaxID=2259172 RepID=UPI000E25FDDE|nr:2TM domain-containing protein [Lewinella sp. IMCC34191]
MKEDDLYEQARKKVKAKKGFVSHLIAYLLTLALLYVIMSSANNGDLLPVMIVALSWGIGVAAHYFSTFGTENLEIFGVNADWEEDELEKELDRLIRKRELKDQIRKERDLLNDHERLDLREPVKRPMERDGLV